VDNILWAWVFETERRGWDGRDWVADVHDAEVEAPLRRLAVEGLDVASVADAGSTEGDLFCLTISIS